MAQPREVDNVFSKRVAKFTLFFNFLLVIFSGLLWKVSKDANDTTVASQRASISSSGPAVIKLPNADGKTLKGVSFFYSLVNSGTTAAKAAVAESNVHVGRTTPQKGVNFDDLPQAERLSFVLGPKGLIQLAPISVSLEDLNSAEQGRTHVFLWGWTTYRDVFPGSPVHLTEFCTDITSVSFSKPDHGDFTGEVNFGSPPCPTHNCYDDECEDYAVRIK